MKTSIFVPCLTVLSVIALSTGLNAQIITPLSTTQSAFDALITSGATETLEGLNVPTGGIYFAGTSAALGSTTATNSVNIYGIGPAPAPGLDPVGSTGDGSDYIVGDGNSDTLLTLTTPQSAFGTSVFNLGSAPALEIAVVSGYQTSDPTNTFSEGYTFTAPGATGSAPLGFEGFLASPGYVITSVDYVTSLGIDNITTGTAPETAAPEPSSWALIAAGGAALAFLRRRSVATNV